MMVSSATIISLISNGVMRGTQGTECTFQPVAVKPCSSFQCLSEPVCLQRCAANTHPYHNSPISLATPHKKNMKQQHAMVLCNTNSWKQPRSVDGKRLDPHGCHCCAAEGYKLVISSCSAMRHPRRPNVEIKLPCMQHQVRYRKITLQCQVG